MNLKLQEKQVKVNTYGTTALGILVRVIESITTIAGTQGVPNTTEEFIITIGGYADPLKLRNRVQLEALYAVLKQVVGEKDGNNL